MKNILSEQPGLELAGRPLASVDFVDNSDIQSKVVLDIGCGYGWCELNFLQRGVAKIVGSEISDKDLETIRKNVKNEKLQTQVASAIKLPFDSNSFDTVVSWEVIEHIPKGTETLMFSEVSRVLKPGGAFYMSTPHDTFFTNILDPAWLLVGHRHYSKEPLEALAKKSGFQIEKVNIKGGWWSLIYIVNMYVAKWIFRRPPFFDSYFAKKETVEYQGNTGFANIFIKFRKAL